MWVQQLGCTENSERLGGPVNPDERQKTPTLRIKLVIVLHHQIREFVQVDECNRKSRPFCFEFRIITEPAGTDEERFVVRLQNPKKGTNVLTTCCSFGVFYLRNNAWRNETKTIGRRNNISSTVATFRANSCFVAHRSQHRGSQLLHVIGRKL